MRYFAKCQNTVAMSCGNADFYEKSEKTRIRDMHMKNAALPALVRTLSAVFPKAAE